MRAAVWLLFALVAAPAAAAEPLRLLYEVYSSGFHVMTFEVAIEEGGGGYQVGSVLRTSGIADTLVGFRMEARTAGAIEAQRAAPTRYESASTWRRKQRQATVEYRGNGSPLVALSPAHEDEEVTPIPPASLGGTIDPLSAALRAARTASATGTCRQSLPVFDGRRRYDLHFEDLGRGHIKRTKYSAFEGPALTCRVRQERIGGFVRKDGKEDLAHESILYVAEVLPGAPPVPVRAELETGWGWLYVHLAEIAGGGGQVRLAQ